MMLKLLILTFLFVSQTIVAADYIDKITKGIRAGAAITREAISSSDNFMPVDDWDFHQYMKTQSKDLEEIFEVDKHVEAVKQKAKEKHVSDKTVTILVGRTGVGKTRALHLLNKQRLYARCDSSVNEYSLQPFEGELSTDEETQLQGLPWRDWIKLTASTIKAEGLFGKFSSKAEQPIVHDQQEEKTSGSNRSDGYRPDTKRAQLLGSTLDLPGIQNIGANDSTKSTEIIRDSYELKQLLKEFKRFKLMLVVPEADIAVAGKAEKFLEAVARLDEVFPGGFESYKDRLYFMPSHAVDITSPQIFKNRVKKALEGRGKFGEKLLSEQEERILTHVSTLPDDRIFVFAKPKRNGVVDWKFLKPFMDADTQFPPYSHPVHICISEAAKRYLREITSQPVLAASELLKSFERNLHFRIPPMFHEYSAKKEESAEVLREELASFSHTLEERTDITKVQKALDRMAPASGKNLKLCTDVYTRYMELIPASERANFKVPQTEAHHLSKTIRSMSYGPRWLDSNEETFWGSYILGTSDITSYLKTTKKPRFISRSTVGIVDADMTAPGISLLWASRLLKLGQQQRMIDLSGEHADKLPADSRADDKDGKDGLPGKSGKSGGHFVGVFDNQDIPLSLLELRSNGGSGSDGQRGHNGKNGSNGRDEDPKERMAAEAGEPGQSAGKGGKGGKGGDSGFVRLMTFDRKSHSTQWHQSLNPGISGNDGEAGEPGVGGKHGKVHVPEGTLIKSSGTNGETRWVDYFQPVVRIGSGTVCAVTGTITSPIAGKWPWNGFMDGISASQSGVDTYYDVHKTLKDPQKQAPNGNRLTVVNDKGWKAPEETPKFDEQTIARVLNLDNPLWEWAKVTSHYRRT